MTFASRWAPALTLTIGAIATVGVDTQRSMTLEAPLDSVIPLVITDHVGDDVRIPDAELEAAGVTAYLMRTYTRSAPDSASTWSVYVGYYDRQLQGKSIHSPKNCLPGAGWEALASSEISLMTTEGAMPVNRYLLQKDGHRALVLYWYQGRGRVVANEYLVKANLLRDAALRKRSEEALVRIVVPVRRSEREAFAVAEAAAKTVATSLMRALPS